MRLFLPVRASPCKPQSLRGLSRVALDYVAPWLQERRERDPLPHRPFAGHLDVSGPVWLQRELWRQLGLGFV